MGKVKIVQIAYMGDGGRTEYLDDQGRVWFDNGHYEDVAEVTEKTTKREYTRTWVPQWMLVDLPNESDVVVAARYGT